jgi:hypothetical protein
VLSRGVGAIHKGRLRSSRVVTSSYFTRSAKELAGTAAVRLIDREGLQRYLDDYNQKLIEMFQAEEAEY